MDTEELRDIIYTQGILLQARIELEGMLADNKSREMQGLALSYGEKQFLHLIEKHGVHHNGIVTMLYRR